MKKNVVMLFIGIIVGASVVFSVSMLSNSRTIVSMPLKTSENPILEEESSEYKANLIAGHLCCVNGIASCCQKNLENISQPGLLKDDTTGLLPENIAEQLGQCCLDGVSGCCNALEGVVSGL
jgi:hypothetical protein